MFNHRGLQQAHGLTAAPRSHFSHRLKQSYPQAKNKGQAHRVNGQRRIVILAPHRRFDPSNWRDQETVAALANVTRAVAIGNVMSPVDPLLDDGCGLMQAWQTVAVNGADSHSSSGCHPMELPASTAAAIDVSRGADQNYTFSWT